MADRPHNFNAGPAILPLSVMEEVQAGLLNSEGSGLSVLEWSHRGADYEAVRQDAEARLRRLLGLGDGHRVLFLQGGASLQFAMVPMNLAVGGRPGAYVNTGTWSKKALQEAERLGSGKTLWDGADDDYTRIPEPAEWGDGAAGTSFVHITSNNTIKGTEWASLPDTGDVPLVVDMSSNILSRAMEIDRIGLLYAGAQKNLGPAGVTVVAFREDLLDDRTVVPAYLDYKTHVKAKGIYNTPSTFGVYLLGKVLAWVEASGGVAGIERENVAKADLVYGEIDRTDFWRGTAKESSRSRMNVTFRLPSEDLEKTFIEESKAAGFTGLKGHRSVGGCRASIYNAMPKSSVEALVGFMQDFEKRHG